MSGAPMTRERLAEIDARANEPPERHYARARDDVFALLAEVRRLTPTVDEARAAAVAALRAIGETWADDIAKRIAGGSCPLRALEILTVGAREEAEERAADALCALRLAMQRVKEER